MSKLVKFKIGRTEWEVIHYVGLKYFCVYKNAILAKNLYLPNEFETESHAMLAILKTYQISGFHTHKALAEIK